MEWWEKDDGGLVIKNTVTWEENNDDIVGKTLELVVRWSGWWIHKRLVKR